MTDPILHHHDPSPFAEKIRLAFGLKGLDWQSVQVAMVMPRPDMTALTGGYRRIPVLQIGADIYCDTTLIARELERRYPDPTLFPDGRTGLGIALGSWSDHAFFDAGASIAMSIPELPADVLEDRRKFFTHLDFDSFAGDLPHLHAQLAGHARLVEDSLTSGEGFLAGDRPGWVDILAWFPLWMARGYVARASEVIAGLDRLAAWQERMGSLGHGHRSELTSGEALEVARAATPQAEVDVTDPFLGLAAGDAVAVTPVDYGRDPVEGELVIANRREIAIRRTHAATGDVVVHFPRVGFRVQQAT